MNEETLEAIEVSVKYTFIIRKSEWSKDDVRYDWWEETTEASSDEWFNSEEAARRDMKEYMSEYLGLED